MTKNWIAIKNGRPDDLWFVRDGNNEFLHTQIVADVTTHLQPVTIHAFAPGDSQSGDDGFVCRGMLPGEKQEWLVCEGPSTPQELKNWESVKVVFATHVEHHGRAITNEGEKIAVAQTIREAQAVVKKFEDPNFDVGDVFFDFTSWLRNE